MCEQKVWAPAGSEVGLQRRCLIPSPYLQKMKIIEINIFPKKLCKVTVHDLGMNMCPIGIQHSLSEQIV